ncbi:esterase-like activity of phytase family protein [Mycobacterium sp. IDR2000157661]|nr:esterase-like activity of phytase family protein [Mycobacterium sp. IDR2000157661]
MLSACGAAATAPAPLTYLGQLQLPGKQFDGTVVGGLSDIDYDPATQLYFIASDDRSEQNPARFYTARISLSDNGVDNVEFVSTHPWLNRDGQPFAASDTGARPPSLPPDPEGIAFDPRRQLLYWSYEGTRVLDAPNEPALSDPRVLIATPDGRYVGEFALPPVLRTSTGQTGPRNNLGLEGLTLAPGGQVLWAAMEGPGFNDGAVPTEAAGALTRVMRFNVETRRATAQYAYPLDPVPTGPDGDNGLTALLALSDTDFLAVERSYGSHVSVRVYRVTLGDAEDVSDRSSLTSPPVRPMSKTLLADLTSAVDPLDNVEAITFGPELPDGRRSVLMVSDDNFSDDQITQFLAFAL